MHPILANLRRLLLYLLGWIPLLALVVYLLKTNGGLGWLQAAGLGIPLCLLYAILCLSSWYYCRSTAAERTGPLPPVLVHLAAAAVSSGFWVLLGRVLSAALSQLKPFAGLDRHLTKATPLLFGLG